jgi:hypothetical protein
LFDTQGFTLELEQLYARIWENAKRGVRQIILPETRQA